MGAGAIFVPIFAFVALLVTPLQWPYLTVIGCMLAAMYVGLSRRQNSRRMERIRARRMRPGGEHRGSHRGVPYDRIRRLAAVSEGPAPPRPVAVHNRRVDSDLGHDQLDQRDRRRRRTLRKPVGYGAGVSRRNSVRRRLATKTSRPICCCPTTPTALRGRCWRFR